jgi:hypothetical protein
MENNKRTAKVPEASAMVVGKDISGLRSARSCLRIGHGDVAYHLHKGLGFVI